MLTPSDTDARHLLRAIDLAGRSTVAVRPNPSVGAVITIDDEVVGEGYHRQYGGPHAEVEAIRATAGRDLHGATLYVSLEPCCHQGRNPPCTDAILAAGIGRVVVAADDPSAHASGRGLGILRDEGIEVVVAEGEIAERARLQIQPFRKHVRTGRPWVLFKSAMSLDGKVATSSGDSKWISGPDSRRLAHEWRATSDGVAIGIGTALADDPQLTARVGGSDSLELADRQPRRIVFDSLARLSPSSRLVEQLPLIPLTVVVSRAAPRAATHALEAHGVDVMIATGENGPARVCSALDQLGAGGITSMLLEGGPKLAGTFLDAGQIDEIRLFVAPLVLGGRSARDLLESDGVEQIRDAISAQTLECERVGEDLLMTARIRAW